MYTITARDLEIYASGYTATVFKEAGYNEKFNQVLS